MDLIDAALRCKQPDGRFSFLSPTYTQAKDTVWQYLKRFTAEIEKELAAIVVPQEIREALDYGVVKMNIDTDLQFAFTEGIRDYMVNKIDYLRSQIGNPEGDDKPNKKYYDPRKWLREGEITFIDRLVQAFEDLNNINTL